MSKAPYMPVFIGELFGDTSHLSSEQFGAYCRILFATWRRNGVAFADDDATLACVCHMSAKRWREKIRPALVGFFDLSEGTWRQGRLENEWIFVQKQMAQKRCAGNASAKARSLKNKKTGSTAVAEPLQRQCQQPILTLRKEEKITLAGDPKENSEEVAIVEPQVPAVIADIEPPTVRKRDSPKRQIPADWWPSPDGVLYAEERAGWFALDLAGEVEHFRDHHRSNRNAFADHDAAWRNWVRNGIKFRKHETGRRNGHDAETAAFDAITRH